MPDSLKKQDIVKLLAGRMKTDEATAAIWLDTMLDIMLKSIKTGKSVNLKNFGSFYVKEGKGPTCFKFNPSQQLRAFLGWSSTWDKGK